MKMRETDGDIPSTVYCVLVYSGSASHEDCATSVTLTVCTAGLSHHAVQLRLPDTTIPTITLQSEQQQSTPTKLPTSQPISLACSVVSALCNAQQQLQGKSSSGAVF